MNRCVNSFLIYAPFPDVWKMASVILIHKKDSINECNYYRPAALTSCLYIVFGVCFLIRIQLSYPQQLTEIFQSGVIPPYLLQKLPDNRL